MCPSSLQNFLKALFADLVSPCNISDRGTHFCFDQFSKVMQEYELLTFLTAFTHKQWGQSGQEVSNRAFEKIPEWTIGNNAMNIEILPIEAAVDVMEQLKMCRDIPLDSNEVGVQTKTSLLLAIWCS
ncbi:hypothetical protein Tco_1221167 [Tanacetum coccineum]